MTGNRRTNADFCICLTADGGFVLQVLLFWVLDAVPLFGNYLKWSIMWLIGMMSLEPQAHVELSLSCLAPSDIPIYEAFLLLTNINNLTIRGGFAVDVLKKLTMRTNSQHLLPHLKLLNIMDWFPFLDEESRMALSTCLQSRIARYVCLTICLMDTEGLCMDFGKLGYIIEREFWGHPDTPSVFDLKEFDL